MALLPPRNIRNAIKSFIPNWLARKWGFSFLLVVALIADEFIELLTQGTLAPLPGLGTPDAFPLIGQSRGIIRGLGESDSDYAARLIQWLTLWQNAGSEETLLALLQVYLGGNLTIRHIHRSGQFVTINPDGTFTRATDATWNWDSRKIAIPEVIPYANRWSDCWIVAYINDGRYPSYTNLSDPNWLAAWGTYHDFGSGMRVPRIVVDGVYSILSHFKAAHAWIGSIVWASCNPADLFAPGSLAGEPDGAWADESVINSGASVVGRPATIGGHIVRFWDPANGG